MKSIMVLIFLIVSTTVLGEGPKNCDVQLPILSCDYNSTITFCPPAIFMTTNSTISIDDDCKGEKVTGLLVAIVIKDQIPSEGASFCVIKTLSIKEEKNYFNFERGPLKKVLKKPIKGINLTSLLHHSY